MLPIFLHSFRKNIPKILTTFSKMEITTTKNSVDKKKKIYQSQIGEANKTSDSYQLKQAQQKKARQSQYEHTLFEIGKEMMQAFSSRNNLQRKKVEITSLLNRNHAKLMKQYKILDIRQLINYVQIVKGMCFMRLDQLQIIDTVYKQLALFMHQPQYQQTLKQFIGTVWSDTIPLQMKIRLVCVAQFMDQQSRNTYFRQIIPFIKYFKSTQILILLYQKCKFQYAYSYQLIDQIHNNQYYGAIQDINQAYFKMLFVQSIKGQFAANDDGIYSKIFNSINQKPNYIAHSAFSKLIKMLHSQHYFVQTESSRFTLQQSLNNFINIAKNQKYDEDKINLEHLVQIYLGFEQSNSTGQILLNQITYYSTKINNFKISSQNFAFYQKLLFSVLKNIQTKLKYERINYLNKEYTNDTVNFLKQFIPKYLPHWPQVIFELNSASYEIFGRDNNELLMNFKKIFKNIIKDKRQEISLSNVTFLKKVLQFLKAYQGKKFFQLPEEYYLKIIKQFEGKQNNNISNEQLQILYLTLSLLGERIKQLKFKPSIMKINLIIEANIEKQMNISSKTLINSLDEQIIWLSLCSALIKKQNFIIDESLLEIFINEKLYYMINSLKYAQVYEILNFTVGLSRIKAQVYEALLYSLSTFIIYIHQRTNQRNNNVISPFYLNHKYIDYYPKIVKLVLENQSIFRTVQNKNAFRILQIMFYQNITQYGNQEILKLLDVLSESTFLITSMIRKIGDIKFNASQLEPYEHSKSLKSFQYYNKSILRYFEGKYNQSEVKTKLKRDTLTKQQITEYFSKIQVYKTIIMDGELNIRFQMPEPKTDIQDFKYMYACQRIFQRIKMFNQYDFKQDMKFNPQQKIQFKDIDFGAEKRYIDKEVLIPNVTYNDFRLENRVLPKYIKLQAWKSYVFFNKQCFIDPKDFELNNQKLTDQILNKVIKGGLYGSYQRIREVSKEFNSNQQIINAMRQAKIQFQQYGSAVQIKSEDKENILLTLLFSNNTNYKIIYICAHFMAKKGVKVVVIKQHQKIEPLVNFLKQHFSPKQIQNKGQNKANDNSKQDEHQNDKNQ